MIINNKAVKKTLDWAGRKLHSPEQRLILGATALATQPFIDLNNKEVDKETRKTSAARTIAKIIAGTLVGFAVRAAGIRYITKVSQYTCIYDGKLVKHVVPKKGSGFFVPLFAKTTKGHKSVFPITPKKLEKKFELYRKAMGTFIATIAMIGTNFLIDAPLTKLLTGVFQKQLTSKLPADGISLEANENKEVSTNAGS